MTAKKAILKKENIAKTKEKIEWMNIYSTTYGYWRYWVKYILAEGGIAKYRFVKDEDSYNGKIAISKSEIEKAKKVLADYKGKHPDEKELFW